MRKSNLPFRKLNVANLYKFSKISLLSIGSIFSLYGCSSKVTTLNKDVTSPESVQTAESHSFITLTELKQNWLEVRSANSELEPSGIRIDAKSCVSQKLVLGASLRVLGQEYDVSVEEENNQLSVVSVEDSETKYHGVEVTAELKNEICEAMESRKGSVLLVKDEYFEIVRTSLLSVLKGLVPDCATVQFEGKSAECQLVSMFPQPALVLTEDFQKAMIRTWSRQPYILARRTGIIGTLAKTSIDFNNDDGFTKFCRILQFSLPEELPVVMTSKRWQSALCSGQSKSRREAALFGLAKATRELSMLKELYESTSSVGMFAVKIPEKSIPERVEESSRQPLRVKIIPDENVSKKLVDEAKKYLGRPEKEVQPRRLTRHKRESRASRIAALEALKMKAVAASQPISSRSDMCWHPVFGESWGLLRIADGMKLAGDDFKLECGFIYERNDAAERELASLSKYLLHSLSSETEFVMDNGQSKLLRLPAGKYQYSVQVLPANPLDSEEIDDEHAPKTTGEIEWGGSKSHSIKFW